MQQTGHTNKAGKKTDYLLFFGHLRGEQKAIKKHDWLYSTNCGWD